MDKKLVLAVAGSGKTYMLCNEIDENKRNLVLAYTNENIKNIYQELINKNGYIPPNTIISTFDSFILNYIARPLVPLISYKYDKKYMFDDYGCAFNLTLPEHFNTKTKKWNNLFAENKLGHYLTTTGKFYGERIPKFINKFNLLDISIVTLKQHFDKIYIDEVQDFAGERFDLLKSLIEKFDNVLLVGDYYQHSVSAKPDRKKYPFVSDMTYSKYKKEFEKLGVNIDDVSLKSSRRCSDKVCKFIQNKLNIKIESLKINDGNVIILDSVETADEILNDNSVFKLVYSEANKYPFRSMNWGYSKGDTFDKTCVILNQNMKGLEQDNPPNLNLSDIIRNKLYVALSRSKGDLYILPYDIFNKCSLSKKKEN